MFLNETRLIKRFCLLRLQVKLEIKLEYLIDYYNYFYICEKKYSILIMKHNS